jgi:hypothetical protein
MNNNKNTGKQSFSKNQNNNSYLGILDSSFAVKEILKFDFFQNSNIYQEKLQIVFANIRV